MEKKKINRKEKAWQDLKTGTLLILSVFQGFKNSQWENLNNYKKKKKKKKKTVSYWVPYFYILEFDTENCYRLV